MHEQFHTYYNGIHARDNCISKQELSPQLQLLINPFMTEALLKVYNLYVWYFGKYIKKKHRFIKYTVESIVGEP